MACLMLDPSAPHVEHCEAQDTKEDAARGMEAEAGCSGPSHELKEPQGNMQLGDLGMGGWRGDESSLLVCW